ASGVSDWELDEVQQNSCGGALHLVQALQAAHFEKPPKLWLVTQGAQALPGQAEVAVLQSPLVGLSKAIAEEHPEFSCRLVDLDMRAGADEAARLLFNEIWLNDGEEQVALRGEYRYVARLCPQKSGGKAALTLPARDYELVAAPSGLIEDLKFQRRERPA